MRNLISTALAVSSGVALAAALVAGAEAKPPAKPAPAHAPSAVSAERFGIPASYRAPARQGHGYSVRSRHIADCLATYRHYDPDTDRVLLRPGVSRRCEL